MPLRPPMRRSKKNCQFTNKEKVLYSFRSSSHCLWTLISRMVKFRVSQQDEPVSDSFASLSAPARRALQSNGIKTLEHLSKYSEKEILKFHGIGKTTIPVLDKALKEKGMGFRK